MDREQIIEGLRFTKEMFLLNPRTNETITKEQLNDMDRTTVDACEGAIEILQAIPSAEPKIVPIVEIHFDEDKMREICKEVAENIVVEYDFKGKTNGEVIKMLFPNIDTYFSNVIDLRLWWNSLYEPQERSEE